MFLKYIDYKLHWIYATGNCHHQFYKNRVLVEMTIIGTKVASTIVNLSAISSYNSTPNTIFDCYNINITNDRNITLKLNFNFYVEKSILYANDIIVLT